MPRLMLWLARMPTQSQLDQVRRAFDRLSKAAESDWQKVLATLSRSDRVMMSLALAQGWVGIVDKYGSMAATLAADYFEVRASEIGIKPKVKMAPGVDERRATARLGWALSTGSQLANASILLDELVLQPYRSTLQDSAWASGGGWARVPSGAEPCAFCLMLASRGGVYRSEGTAGGDKDYHGYCRCVPELVDGPETYPDGYDPDALYDAYSNARQQAGSGKSRDILSELRKQQGSH